MPESQMAVVAVAAVAAIAVGGAAIAFMYHCCQDQVKRQKKEKVERINSQLGIRDEDAHHRYERREKVDVVEIGKAKRPVVRTVEEIKAYYGRPSRKDASSTAGIATEAKNKLMERGEKLQAVNDKTQELESQAESFASLAEELAKKMKARKWWEL